MWFIWKRICKGFLPLHLQFCIASQVKIGTFFIYSIENVSDVGEWKIL